jgi:hypothetical protein
MTAFRVARHSPVSTIPAPPRNAVGQMQGKPIRMSFKTDRPFYPYREPVAEKANDGAHKPSSTLPPRRFLRVYCLAPERLIGALGTGSTNWVGMTAWSDKLTEDQAKQVAASAKIPGNPTESMWLTEFEDPSTPRRGTDEVYFGASPDKSPTHRPAIIREIVEYYDAESENGTPYAAKFALAIGAILLIGLLWMVISQHFRRKKL